MKEIPRRQVNEKVRILCTDWAKKHHIAGKFGVVIERGASSFFLGALCTIRLDDTGECVKVYECSLLGT